MTINGGFWDEGELPTHRDMGYLADGTPFRPSRDLTVQDREWHEVFPTVGDILMFPNGRWPGSDKPPLILRASDWTVGSPGANQLTPHGLKYLEDTGWNPMNTNLGLQTSSAWGEWEMVRDLVQNALDETENFRLFVDEEANLWIEDEGTGMTPAAFMMGTEALQKGPEARGKFGTGMKIAVVAALRNEHAISFATSDGFMGFAFMSGFECLGDLQEPTLWIAAKRAVNGEISFPVWVDQGKVERTVTVPLPPVAGTRWMIRAYDSPLFKDRFATTMIPMLSVPAVMSSRAPVGTKQRHDQLFKGTSNFSPMMGEPTPGGRIYGRDIYMRNTTYDTPVSYNLWGFEMAHDRHAESYFGAVEVAAASLWSKVRTPSAIKWFLERIFTRPLPYPETGFEDIEDNYEQTVNFAGRTIDYGNVATDLFGNEDLWREAFHDLYGPKAVVYTDKVSRGVLEHYGLYPVKMVMTNSDSAKKIMQAIARVDMDELQDAGFRLRDEAERNKREDEDLTTDQRGIIRAIRVLKAEMLPRPVVSGQPLPRPDVVVTDLAQEYGGVFIPDIGPGGTIYIDIDHLDTVRNALDVFIHEYAHYFTLAPDTSEQHILGISRVGEYVAALFAAQKVPDSFFRYIQTLEWHGFPPERQTPGNIPGPEVPVEELKDYLKDAAERLKYMVDQDEEDKPQPFRATRPGLVDWVWEDGRWVSYGS